MDFVAQQAVFDGAVKGEERGVVQLRVFRTLLEIKREQGEAPGLLVRLGAATGDAEELKKLVAGFLAEAVVGHHRIEEIRLLRIDAGVARVGKQRRQGPRRRFTVALPIPQRPERLLAQRRAVVFPARQQRRGSRGVLHAPQGSNRRLVGGCDVFRAKQAAQLLEIVFALRRVATEQSDGGKAIRLRILAPACD